MQLEPNHVSYYSILGLQQHATTEEIKRAYRSLLLSNHPDKVTSSSSSTVPITLIKSAYHTLIDNRAAYDTALHSFNVRSGLVDVDGIDTYDLAEFEYNSTNSTFTLDCPRCTTKNGFTVTEQDLDSGINETTDDKGFTNVQNLLLQCNACSLWLCLAYTAD